MHRLNKTAVSTCRLLCLEASRGSQTRRYSSCSSLLSATFFCGVRLRCYYRLYHTERWETWKKEYSQVYKSDEIEQNRRAIWESNMQFVNEHNANADKVGFTVEMNEFAALQTNEFSRTYNRNLEDESDDNDNSTLMMEPGEEQLSLPTSVDWRRKGAVTSIKKQGCGSCYAFSAAGALEGQYAIKYAIPNKKPLVSLSVQQIIDCSSEKYGNNGCNGGTFINSFKYVMDHTGIQSEQSYPYIAKEQRCKYNEHEVVVGCKGYRVINSERELQRAVAFKGPISLAIDSNQRNFQLYKRGVYFEPICSVTKYNHAVLVVGYGDDHGTPYWLIKNSWGKKWGIEGYAMMSRDQKNQCGIAIQAAYPIICLLHNEHDA